MNKHFNVSQAKKFLENRELIENELREKDRLAVLASIEKTIKMLFSNSDVEIFLVGSITQPYKFYPHSDIDIVLRNFKGDRFDLWTHLESKIKRNCEIIIFENCHFQEHVIKTGYRVL